MVLFIDLKYQLNLNSGFLEEDKVKHIFVDAELG